MMKTKNNLLKFFNNIDGNIVDLEIERNIATNQILKN